MDARDFVAMTLLASGGQVQGKTKLQKLVYFVGVLTDSLEELGYRPHFYGPYSDDVAYAITQLKAIGALDQVVSEWGYDRSGFEVRRYDFKLNDPGKTYAAGVSQRCPDLWRRVQKAVQAYNEAGDKDYVALSIAAKTYFLLGHKKAPATDEELTQLASQFGWTVSVDQVRQAAEYLSRLHLIEPSSN